MKFNSAKLIYFSPTRTTKRVLEGVVQGVQADSVEHLDLTPPEARSREFEELRDELAIIGAPVYGGRIPSDAVHRLRRLRANDTPAVVIVVYGNRAFEDALLELNDLARHIGFKPVASGAFIGEHSYDNVLVDGPAPIARGRPDEKDLRKAMEFGGLIRKKMNATQTLESLAPLQVPGSFPYKGRGKHPETSPVTRAIVCTKCEECVTVCPTAAIAPGDAITTDANACILCSACVKICPTGARVWRDAWVEQVTAWLSKGFRERREPETFI